MAKRVHEIAKELGVKSTAIVAKCKDEGIDVKNHMSTLSAGLEATIREWFSDGEHVTTVETTARVDLKKVRVKKKAKKKKKVETVAEQEEQAVAEKPEEVVATAVAISEAEPGAQGAIAAEDETETAGKLRKRTAKPKRVSPKELAEVGVAGEPEPTEDREVELEAVGQEAVAQAGEETTEPAVEEVSEPEGVEPSVKRMVQPIKPVKVEPVPHVPTPVKLQGPKVVRVERPDSVSTPPRGIRKRVVRAAPAEPETTTTTRGGRKGRRRRYGEEAEQKGEASKRGKGRGVKRGGRRHDVGQAVAGAHEWGDRDLQERQERLAQASGSKLRGRERRLAHDEQGTHAQPHAIEKAKVKEPITIKALSAAMGVRTGEIMDRLIGLGVMANINQPIDSDAAMAIALEFGVELTVEETPTLLDVIAREFDNKEVPEDQLTARPPVVAFLGHVDHGKTSLLDQIRKTNVFSGEAGGITQHIGSYLYDDGERRVAFLDTPGHKAFTEMRARGANMTDIVVLVVAADDGVMPQTEEAISHAQAAKVPIVVAMNKIDLPGSDENRVLGQLSEKGLVPTMWGGDTEIVRTSAATGEGISDLVEHLDYIAELHHLRAKSEGASTGWIIEAEMKTGHGVEARLLVKSGSLKPGDIVVSGCSWGRVRTLLDVTGAVVKSAGPATPVVITGLDEMPVAGERYYVIDSVSHAKEVADEQKSLQREKSLARRRLVTLENLFTEIAAGELKELNVIIKADVQGSVDVLTNSVMEMNTAEVAVRVLHAAVGGVTESDVLLAEASNAIIIAFQVVAEEHARVLAERSGVEIRLYRVIYQITDDIKQALEGMLAPRIEEKQEGSAEVRDIFRISRIGVIAGCYATSGVIKKSARVRLIRDNIVIQDNIGIESLRRGKDDAAEVRSGFECGIKLAGFDDMKIGDRIDTFVMIEVSRTLESVTAGA